MSTNKKLSIEYFFKALEYVKYKEGLSYSEIAEKAGINRQYLSLLKLGKRNPKTETLEKIAAAFGYQLIDFFKLGGASIEPDKNDGATGAGWKTKYEELSFKYMELLEKYTALLEDNGAGAVAERWRAELAPDADTVKK